MEPTDRPGGAGLAAAIAAAGGDQVTLVCALGADAEGARVRELLEAAGVAVVDLGLGGSTPEKVRVRAGGRALVRLGSGGESTACGELGADGRAALARADAVLVSDYGRGVAAAPSVRAALAALRGTPVVWDPHPRGAEPVPGCVLVTPNAGEAARAAAAPATARSAETPVQPLAGDRLAAHEAHGRALQRRWRAVDVCVTLGERGALLVGAQGPALAIPAPHVASGDPCGAGDCFAATAAVRLAGGALPSDAVRAAVVAASAFVAAGGASGWSAAQAPEPVRDTDARALAARVRAAGGTVVATGG